MFLKKIDDPRDNLAKARRWELQQFAEANRVSEVKPDMPATLMRNILRSKGLTQIPVPDRPLGNTNQPHPRPMYQNGLAVANPKARPRPEQPQGVEIDAEADLARQYQTKKPARPPRLVERPKSEINKLRDECKALGIKMGRRDAKPDLKAKIEAHKSTQPIDTFGRS
jgi:hypothetical protein